jgi:hypothetical protein
MSTEDAIQAWFQLFPELELSLPPFTSLKDGVAVTAVYSYLSGQELPSEAGASSPAWFLARKRIRAVSGKLTEFHRGTPFDLACDCTAIARQGDAAEIKKLVAMLIAYALKSPKADDVKARMQSLGADHSAQIDALVNPGGNIAKRTNSTSRNESPSASSVPALAPGAASDGPPPPALNTLKADISALNKSNEALKAEIAEMGEQKDGPVTDQQIAEATASLFPL